MKKFLIIAIISSMMIAGICFAASEQVNKGAEQISINAGSKGNIAFPHSKHQAEIKDCNVCHAMYPQEKSSITTLKQGGKLSDKQVMNSQCIDCHKKMKDENKKTGPTSCSQCHK